MSRLFTFPIPFRSPRGSVSAGPTTDAPAAPERTPLEVRALDSARISATSVSAPLGRFLLVRQGTALGAVRFTHFHRDPDQKPGEVLVPGADRTTAEYDWYLQGDGSGDFTKPNVTYGHGKLRDARGVRIGRFVFNPFAAVHVKCGPLVVRWRYPTALVFNMDVLDPRVEDALALAPTKAAYIRDVHLRKMHLTWYRVDPTRTTPLIIPLAQLP